MKLVGSAVQQLRHYLYDASGVIGVGGTPQLVLAQSQARSHLLIQNLSDEPLYVEIGAARGVATLSGGGVASVSVSSPVGATNAGFNYTRPPVVRFLGGGQNLQAGGIHPSSNSSYVGLAQPQGANSTRTAVAHATLSGGAVSAIVVDDPGAGYVLPPFVFIANSDLDPAGCAVPTSDYSMLLASGAPPLIYNGTVCPTDPVAILGATTGSAFVCKWMD